MIRLIPRVASAILLATVSGGAFAQAPQLHPARNTNAAPRATSVGVTLMQPLPAGTGLHVFSQQAGGRKAGVQSTAGYAVSFAPTSSFWPGETVTATLATATTSTPAGQVWRFTAATTGGTGTFGGGGTVALGAEPLSPVLADIDADGDLDLLAVNRAGGSTMSIRLNNGQGQFTSAPDVTIGGAAYTMLVGDINGDTCLDLLVPHSPSNTILTFLGNGRGSFAPNTAVPAVTTAPAALQLGDIDADGDQDLLVLNPLPSSGTSFVGVRLNDGLGNFSVGSDVPVTPTPQDMALGDVDNDGDLDFTVVSKNLSNAATAASVALNDGSGTFTATNLAWTGSWFESVSLADIDADGDLDWLATDSKAGTGGVVVRRNNGTGSFGPPSVVATGLNPRALRCGDVDGDGDLDLLVSLWTDQGVSIRQNDGRGNFSGSDQTALGGYVSGLATGDLDADGDLDWVATSDFAATQGAYVRLNQNRALAATPKSRPTQAWAWPNPVATGQPLRLTHIGPVRYRLTTALGQLVQQRELGGTASEIPTMGLTPGLYLLSISTPDGPPAVQRVIVQ